MDGDSQFYQNWSLKLVLNGWIVGWGGSLNEEPGTTALLKCSQGEGTQLLAVGVRHCGQGSGHAWSRSGLFSFHIDLTLLFSPWYHVTHALTTQTLAAALPTNNFISL